MDKLIIHVTELRVNDNGEEIERSLTQELDHDGGAEEVLNMFRTIMYWLTFAEGTIVNTIPRNENGA